MDDIDGDEDGDILDVGPRLGTIEIVGGTLVVGSAVREGSKRNRDVSNKNESKD